ncbi:MAG: acyl-phosphate glycerol 3-phosphate acyltransferase [Elusimicrobia bacterium RIFOXYA2_FULL_39_19]|nr:MAG: acyl-phosphate glycerol 3-phosphate acyltransferase [Elusimicrobia bacterium RIFOXYA2_FULL_39_19]
MQIILLNILSAAVISYLLGSIPFAYIFARMIKGIDIRQHGSGNPGATNVFRTVGKTAGIIVFILDMLKGFMAVFIVNALFHNNYFNLISALSAIAGHTWTVWLSFKGGKGVATSAGVVIMLVPVSAVIGLSAFFICLFITRYVSISSMLASILVATSTWYFTDSLPLKIAITLLALLIIYRHKTNISRLINKQEPKIKI